MAYRNWQHQSDKLNVNMTPKKYCEVVVVNNANTTVINGGSRKKTPRGGSLIAVVPLPPLQYPKFENSTDFGHFISVVPYFFLTFFLAALAGPWCL